MPTSDYHQISDVLHAVEQLQPRSVLDIGVGFGKWGMLCREVLEVYQGHVDRSEWEVRIDGIEIHDPYRNPLWDVAYNHVYSGNAADILPSLPAYDLILCCDVIEHFKKEPGHSLIRNMLRKSNTTILTSPRGFSPQDATYGNEHERHLSGWTVEDFQAYNCLYKDIGFTFMVVLSSKAECLASVQLLHPLQTLGVRKATLELAHLIAKRVRQKFPAASPKARHTASII